MNSLGLRILSTMLAVQVLCFTVSAKPADEWLCLRSTNFTLVGNAQTVKLGLIQEHHLQYLKYKGLMSLAKLFRMTSYELDQASDVDRKIFYAESWALVHYLVQAGKIEGFNKFLTAVVRNTPP